MNAPLVTGDVDAVEGSEYQLASVARHSGDRESRQFRVYRQEGITVKMRQRIVSTRNIEQSRTRDCHSILQGVSESTHPAAQHHSKARLSVTHNREDLVCRRLRA